MSYTNSEGPRIAVIGGGIGGVAAAAFLRRAGLAATVYEQASALKEVGAGLVVAPNPARLLDRLGVMGKLRQDAVRLEWGWEFRRWEDGTVLSREKLGDACEQRFGAGTYVVHRAALLDALRAAVPPEWLRLSARCVSLDERENEVELGFADGTTVVADVVIGADGIHSTVRGAIMGQTPPEDSGMCAFRTVVPAEHAPEFALRPVQTLWLGPGRHLVHYPINARRGVNLIAIAPRQHGTEESWSAVATPEEFLSEFTDWDPRVTDLIKAGGAPGRWALLDRAPLTAWSTPRTTLLGDAAHPMFPFFAQGAAQAIEDAAVLAKFLRAERSRPADALKCYESARIARTTRLQQVSRGRHHTNHLPDGPEQRARDKELAGRDPLVENDWIYSFDPEA